MRTKEEIQKDLDEANAKFRSYDGGDRPQSPPVSLLRHISDLEVELIARNGEGETEKRSRFDILQEIKKGRNEIRDLLRKEEELEKELQVKPTIEERRIYGIDFAYGPDHIVPRNAWPSGEMHLSQEQCDDAAKQALAAWQKRYLKDAP